MENKIRNAFDKIQTSDVLKENTARFLREKISGKKQVRPRPRLRLASVCAAVLLLIIGGLACGIYFTPNAYVDMDVNPSIGLTLNRFGHVINAQAYNNDGEVILENTDVRFKTYEEATRDLLDAIITSGYLEGDGLVSVTVQANGSTENTMLTGLNQTVAAALTSHHMAAQANIYAVTHEVKQNAQQHHVTPAKYVAITQLQEVDPTATFEGCMGRSIRELQTLTQAHGGAHHGQGVPANNAEDKTSGQASEDETESQASGENLPQGQNGGHHGGHHGGRGNGHI